MLDTPFDDSDPEPVFVRGRTFVYGENSARIPIHPPAGSRASEPFDEQPATVRADRMIAQPIVQRMACPPQAGRSGMCNVTESGSRRMERNRSSKIPVKRERHQAPGRRGAFPSPPAAATADFHFENSARRGWSLDMVSRTLQTLPQPSRLPKGLRGRPPDSRPSSDVAGGLQSDPDAIRSGLGGGRRAGDLQSIAFHRVRCGGPRRSWEAGS